MGYSNPEFLARQLVNFSPNHSLSTATASSATGADRTAPTALPAFLRRTKVNKVSFVVRTIPNAASTGLKAVLLNGTSTAATVTLTTATLGQVLTGTVTVANSTFAADAQPTLNVVGTATASGAANGAFDVVFEVQEQFA
jgi:hypothetical protein